MPRVPSRSPQGPRAQLAESGRGKRQTGARQTSGSSSARTGLLPTVAQPIAARLAAAGSRRAELEALLHAAPPGATPAQLRTLVIDENVTGKRTAASRAKVWRQLNERYVLDATVPEHRAFIEALQATSAPSERGLLLFLMLARSDRLFRDVTLATVSPHLTQAGTAIRAEDVQIVMDRLVGAKLHWSEETRVTARQHVLSALKDFGVLQGGTRKKTARLYPGAQVALFAARLAQIEGLSPRQVLASVWFQLLGLDVEGAWNLLHVAASAGVLRCRRQADVIELELPPLPGLPTPAA